MAIWIQSLSWALICSLGQGMVVYASLWLVLKLMPATSAGIRYHMFLSSLTILLAWFVATWSQQYHVLSLLQEHSPASGGYATVSVLPPLSFTQGGTYGGYSGMLALLQVMLPWLSVCYLVGLILMLVRMSAGMWQLFSLRRSGVSQPGVMLSTLLTSLKARMRIGRSLQLLISSHAPVPMVIGFFRPVILVPAAVIAQLSPGQLEAILLHELAHIRRHDYLINILQTVVETILFFNPFVWLISANIRREREHCCDDLVLDHTGEPLSYATALAALAAHPAPVPSFVVAASGQSNYLFNRIKRIMEMKKNQFSYSRMVAAILMLAAITCSLAWLTPAFAGAGKGKTDKENAPAAKTVQVAVPQTNDGGQNQLIQALLNDHLIDEVKGFIVERNQEKLYINGQLQSPGITARYLSGIRPEWIRVQVLSFTERLNMHPDADLLQLMVPVSAASPCVKSTAGDTAKPGC